MKKTIIVFVFTVILLTTGCGGSDQNRQVGGFENRRVMYSMSMAEMAVMEDGEYYGRTATTQADRLTDNIAAGDINQNEFERKLVKRAHVSIRVENLTDAEESINELLVRFNGYAASSNVDENSRYFSLRVPATHYDVFLAEMNGMGRLLNRNESTEDVTLRYYDLEGRLANKRELLSTFQEYLRRARNIEEILAVEARIAELQFDIENTGTQLRYLANSVDYATIDLQLLGPAATSPIQRVTLGERVKQLFNSFSGFLSVVAIILLGIVIYGIPILIILGLLFWLLFGKVGLLKKLVNRLK